jgi:3'-phosphoadenosine 5'-phosphosulfate sulfotransferase (PAPS reductase)/FAD synthetase
MSYWTSVLLTPRKRQGLPEAAKNTVISTFSGEFSSFCNLAIPGQSATLALTGCRMYRVLWSVGKDSTTLLWLVRTAFLDRIPFAMIHIDTTYKFKEIYDFRDKYSNESNLNLIVAKNEEGISDD